MIITLEEFLKDVTVLDQKIFLVSYYAQKGRISEKSERGKAINEMLSNYKEYLLTGKGKKTLENYVKELYVERISSKTKTKSISPKKISQKGYGKHQKGRGKSPKGKEDENLREELLEVKKKLVENDKYKEIQGEQKKDLEKKLEALQYQNEQMLDMMKAVMEHMHSESVKAERSSNLSEKIDAGVKGVAKDTRHIVETTEKISTDLTKLTVGESMTMIMANRFKNLVYYSLYPAYFLTKLVVVDTYIGSMREAVKFGARPLFILFGYFNIIVTGGVILYAYQALTAPDLIDQIDQCLAGYPTCGMDEDPTEIYYHNKRELIRYAVGGVNQYTGGVTLYLYKAGEIYLNLGMKGWEVVYEKVMQHGYLANLATYVSGVLGGVAKGAVNYLVDSIVGRLMPQTTVYETMAQATSSIGGWFGGWY